MIRCPKEEKMGTQHFQAWGYAVVFLMAVFIGIASTILHGKFGVKGMIAGLLILLAMTLCLGWKFGFSWNPR
jgi:hypothetical protein